MSITTLVWLFLFAVGALGAFFNPLYGLFGYLLEYFQRPDLYWWGRELPDLRWNFTIAAIATAAYTLRQSAMEPFRRETKVALILMLLLAINTSIVTTWAVNPELSVKWSTAVWKLVVIFVLFSGIVRTPRALELVILFQIIGAAYWGWDALDARRTSSRLEGTGSGDTLNSNLLAAHLLTIIPLAVMFAILKGKTWIRVVAAVSAPFIINLLILCNSRGATVGFFVAGASSLLLVRRGMRTRMVLGATVAGLALYALADQQFVTRQQTITNPSDRSATSRLELWRGALGMVYDYPFGAGGRGFHLLSPIYVPELKETSADEGRSAHNTYIQTAADWGIQGLILFLLLLGYTFVLLHRVRRERKSPDRLYFISLGLELGLIGTLTAAFFSVRFYGESIYWFCGLSTALYRMTSVEGKSQESPVGETRAVAA